MDELRQVDLFERMRQHVLSAWPGAEDALRRLSEEPGEAGADREAEALIAVLLKIPLTGAQSRRRLHQILEALRREEQDATGLGLTAPQVKRARDGLARLRAIQDESGTARAWAEGLEGPAEMLRAVQRSLPALRGQDRWRFLRSVGASVIIPERRRISLLTRLGLLHSPGESEGETWAEQHDVCLTFASLTSERLASVDFILGAYSGGEPGLPSGVAVCTRTPDCPRCPVNGLCEFHRHRADDLPGRRPTLKNIPEADRPREKLAARGPEALTDAELLAIVLRAGMGGGVTAVDLAQRLLTKHNSLNDLARIGFGELCQEKGIGPAKAAEILAAVELGRRATAAPLERGSTWDSSEEIHQALAPRMATLEHEEFWLLLLDTRLRLIRQVTLSRGDLTGATVHPREVFKHP